MDFEFYKEQNRLAIDTINLVPTKGIPTFWINIMQHDVIERIAGAAPGDYKRSPEETYLAAQKKIGVNVIDQFIPLNPLSMGNTGYENAILGATTGAKEIYCDGVLIDSPEAVVEHMESFEMPWMAKCIENFDEDAKVREVIDKELGAQKKFGSDILKTGYGTIGFPVLNYGIYGYENYFMAFVLYPEVMEKSFKLQADYWRLNNKAVARAYREASLPPLYRLDHDIADSRGTLVNIKTLDKLWLPYFVKALEPVLHSDIKLIWHSDGNLMEMVPRLIDIGIAGFQGFQYEDGMDYKKICSMKNKDGDDLIIVAGVSVTRTLPFGSPGEVKKELEFLVENGPKTGLFLGASSTIVPGVRWENIQALIEGLRYYREHGRN